jgi:hypothetical protein
MELSGCISRRMARRRSEWFTVLPRSLNLNGQTNALNLTDNVEWEQGRQEIERVGIFDCIKFQALPDIGPHQSFNRSTRQILSDFNDSSHETLLFLEDDVQFRDLSHLEEALSELPPDWDIVYLGANLLNGEPERYSDHLFRVKSAWTTHAIGYNKKVIPFLLENQKGFSEEMYDQTLSNLLPSLNAFVVAPMVAYQRPHHSAIWDRYDDYTPIFEASDGLLK